MALYIFITLLKKEFCVLFYTKPGWLKLDFPHIFMIFFLLLFLSSFYLAGFYFKMIVFLILPVFLSHELVFLWPVSHLIC